MRLPIPPRGLKSAYESDYTIYANIAIYKSINSALIPSILFFLSGLAGLLYQIVWLRLAFAHFGILTPIFSTVVSVFMLGLGLGAWTAGRWAEQNPNHSASRWLHLYGMVEGCIGLWALAVPSLMRVGELYLLQFGQMGSAAYLIGSTLAIVIAILPASWLMGMTYPLMMAYARRQWADSRASFSFLYQANMLGALTGSVLTATVLIEQLGFRMTNTVGVAANLINAALCFSLNPANRKASSKKSAEKRAAPRRQALLYPLFITGFVSMAYEIMWTRAFTPILGTTIYATAAVLSIYLAATWSGAVYYRRTLAARKPWNLSRVYTALAFSAFLPIFFIDRRLDPGLAAVAGVLFPFCFFLGYATPQIVDLYGEGNSAAAGLAYAVNIAGCVLGPLAACYFILPFSGSKRGIILLSLLLFTLISPEWRPRRKRRQPMLAWAAGLAVVLLGFRFGVSPEEQSPSPGPVIRRDYAATVVSYGKGFDRMLLVNGVGITVLTPLTKGMAHLPIWCHKGEPHSALVICFGMGTTYRSLLSWGLRTTAVELVPSVRDAFGYYFDDAGEVMKNPLGRVVIDDGRRFLERSDEQFDIVTLDPPPPVEAAGSGLLYSTAFYDLVKRRLAPDGILQQWWPGGERTILSAVARSLGQSFPYVRVYKGVGGVGFHFLASMQPIGNPTVEECIRKMPPAARHDLLEWNPGWRLAPLVEPFLERQIPIEKLSDPMSSEILTDDRPMNEYYLLRRWLAKRKGTYAVAL